MLMLSDSRNRFQRGMIYLFAILATIGVLPFIVLRSLNGQWLNALVDLAIVVVALSSAIITYRNAYASPKISLLTAILYTSGAVAVAHLNQPIFVFWLFPSILANFFLLKANIALIANLCAMLAVLPVIGRLGGTIEMLAAISSLLMCGSMAYTFALLTHRQRNLLQSYATQDALTQLGNRRAMNSELELSIQDFQRAQIPATLILLDLDFFKTVNDNFGHSAGDKVLVELADLLVRRVRRTDRLFRFGGEEFVIIARNTELSAAQGIAEELREQIYTELKSPDGSPLSASFGCAQLNELEAAEDWFIRADKAVYQAKQAGRNCVINATH